MIESGLEAAIDLVTSGPGTAPLLQLLTAARMVTRAPVAYLVVLRDDEVQLIASEGVPLVPFGSISRAEPGADCVFGAPMVCENLTGHPLLRNSPLVTRVGGWRWFAAIPVPLPMLTHPVSLCCADPRTEIGRPSGYLEYLGNIVGGVANTLTMLSVIKEQQVQIARLSEASVATGSSVREEPAALAGLIGGEQPTVTMRFLLSTLIGQRRVLERSGVAYHALTRWRSAIKPWQIDALRALKHNPPAALIDCVANELATAAVDFHGRGSFDAVVPVACGNSGDMCMAYQLAEAVAARLDVAFTPAFDRIDTAGSSHPRKNKSRPAMKLRHKPTSRVLLIDDVATSGAHIAEAAKLLRQTAPAVLPLVWIGPR